MKKDKAKISKKYDKASKGLIDVFQEHIIEYVTKSKPEKIETLDRELNLPHRFVDSVFKIDDKYILNIEFQAKYEVDIEFRLLLYNTLLKVKYELPVRTIVIYLTKNNESKMKDFYLNKCFDTQIDFKFEMIKVWDLKPNEIFSSDMYGMYPLLALSKKDENLTKMIYHKILEADIADDKKGELINILSTLLNLIYKGESVKDMLAIEKLDDILTKARNEGRTEGLTKGLNEGEQIGKLKNSRNLALRLINKKFGKIPEKLEKKINTLENVEKLENIIENIFDINSIKDIEVILKT